MISIIFIASLERDGEWERGGVRESESEGEWGGWERDSERHMKNIST